MRKYTQREDSEELTSFKLAVEELGAMAILQDQKASVCFDPAALLCTPANHYQLPALSDTAKAALKDLRLPKEYDLEIDIFAPPLIIRELIHSDLLANPAWDSPRHRFKFSSDYYSHGTTTKGCGPWRALDLDIGWFPAINFETLRRWDPDLLQFRSSTVRDLLCDFPTLDITAWCLNCAGITTSELEFYAACISSSTDYLPDRLVLAGLMLSLKKWGGIRCFGESPVAHLLQDGGFLDKMTTLFTKFILPKMEKNCTADFSCCTPVQQEKSAGVEERIFWAIEDLLDTPVQQSFNFFGEMDERTFNEYVKFYEARRLVPLR